MTEEDPGPRRGRMPVPPLAEFREVAQPASVRNRASAEHWVGPLYTRHISPHLSRPMVRMGFSANAVTGLMIVAGAAAGFSLLIPGWTGVILAAFFAQLQMVIDGADGEVARWRRTFSPAGVFLDKVGHYVAESLIPVCLGVRAAGGFDTLSTGYGWTTLGALLALFIILNKALNDMVHVARAFSGVPRLADVAGAGAPRPGLIARLRRVARFIPFHRLYHSVELTLIALVATFVGWLVDGTDAYWITTSQWLLLILTPLALITVIGHFVTIMSSNKVKAPTA